MQTEERGPVNAATGQKSPSLVMRKSEHAVNVQESEMLQKPQVWAKSWYLMAHQAAPPCSTKVQKTFMRSVPRRTGCLHFSTPFFLLSAFLQPHFTSTGLTPQPPGHPFCGISEWLGRAGTLGPCCSAVLGSPCTRRPEFLLKDGEKTFRFYMAAAWR